MARCAALIARKSAGFSGVRAGLYRRVSSGLPDHNSAMEEEFRQAAERETSRAPCPAQKKPYSPPQLRRYGDIVALTRAVGNSSHIADGTKGKFSKTF